MFWVGGVRWRPCSDKMVTGDPYVLGGRLALLPMLWVVGHGRHFCETLLKHVVDKRTKHTFQYRNIPKTYHSIPRLAENIRLQYRIKTMPIPLEYHSIPL